jgi:Ser/Thr protein kinase RdoA (MazF antagonist)
MSGAQFWRMQSARGTLVLRRWPAEHPAPERLQFVHEVLFHAARNEIDFLAVPVRAKANISFISDAGHLWELAPWMPGVASYASSPTTEKLRAVMMALAKFHAAVADFPRTGSQHFARVAPAISRRLDQLSQIAEGGHSVLAKTINERVWPDLAPLARRFLATAPACLPSVIRVITPFAKTSFTLQPCLRDIWHDHVLFTGDVVTGIIDYGAIDFDTPATDIARLLGSLVDDDPVGWNEGLAAYRTVRPLTDDEEFAARALNVSGPIVAGYNWLRWIYIDGREFENQGQIVERFQRIVAVCESRAR